MSKSNRDAPTPEVPTEWRRIIMEEGPDGRARPVAVEPVSHYASSQSSSDLPAEWANILEEDDAEEQSISLHESNLDFAERTIPGMRIPQDLFDNPPPEDSSMTVVGVAPVAPAPPAPAAPPPREPMEDFPFSSPPAEARSPQPQSRPRPNPLVVPTPQIPDAEHGTFLPPPPPGIGNQHNQSSYNEPAPSSHYEDETTNVGTELVLEEEESYTPQEVVEEVQEAEEVREEEEAFGQEVDESMLLEEEEVEPLAEEAPTDTSGEYTALSPEDDEFVEGLEANLSATHTDPQVAALTMQVLDLQEQTLRELEHIATTLENPPAPEPSPASTEDQTGIQKQLAELSAQLNQDQEEKRFSYVHSIIQDFLILYDFVDLRFRSLWDRHGEDHMLVHEIGSVREQLLELLQRQELHPIETNSLDFDAECHRVIQETGASHPDEDGQISRIFRQGFRYKERVFRPTEVEIKRYKN